MQLMATGGRKMMKEMLTVWYDGKIPPDMIDENE